MAIFSKRKNTKPKFFINDRVTFLETSPEAKITNMLGATIDDYAIVSSVRPNKRGSWVYVIKWSTYSNNYLTFDDVAERNLVLHPSKAMSTMLREVLNEV